MIPNFPISNLFFSSKKDKSESCRVYPCHIFSSISSSFLAILFITTGKHLLLFIQISSILAKTFKLDSLSCVDIPLKGSVHFDKFSSKYGINPFKSKFSELGITDLISLSF